MSAWRYIWCSVHSHIYSSSLFRRTNNYILPNSRKLRIGKRLSFTVGNHYSDMEFAFASRRQSTRHFGMEISLLAAFVFRRWRSPACYAPRAMHVSRKCMVWIHPGIHSPIAMQEFFPTQAGIQTNHNKKIWRKLFHRIQQNRNLLIVKASFFFDAFPPFAEIPTHGLSVISWLRSAE